MKNRALLDRPGRGAALCLVLLCCLLVRTPAAQAAKTKKMPNVAFIRPPKDAAFLMLNLKLNCCAPNVKPEVWIDQFELAEIDLDELKAALLPSLPAAAAQAAAAAGAAKAR